MEKEKQIKCPRCKSTNLEEVEIEIFETGPVEMVPSGFDPSVLLALIKAPVNAIKKAELVINGEKRYKCKNCKHIFDA